MQPHNELDDEPNQLALLSNWRITGELILFLLGLVTLGGGLWQMLVWVQDRSTWLFGSLCVASFVALALLGLLIVHWRIHRRLGIGITLIDNGVVGWFFSGILVLYGITLGLITVATWGNSSHISELASKESAAIACLYRDMDGYPQPFRNDLRTHSRAITRFIIEKAWPAQRMGKVLEDENQLMNAFQKRLYSFEPNTEGQKAVHAEALHAFNTMIELRRQRIESIHGGAPKILWVVVLLGALITITLSYCFHLEDIRLHGLLTGGLAAMIGLLVFLTASLDQPYHGALSLSPKAYQLVLDQVMVIDPP